MLAPSRPPGTSRCGRPAGPAPAADRIGTDEPRAGEQPAGPAVPDAPAVSRCRRQSRARRRVAAGRGPAACAAVVLAGSRLAWYAYTENHPVPPPRARPPRPGTPAAEAARVLPDRDVRDPSADRAPASPAGTGRRCHRASGGLLVPVGQVRLGFAGGGRSVTEDVVPRAGPPREGHREHGEFAR